MSRELTAQTPKLEVRDFGLRFSQYGRGLERQCVRVMSGLDLEVMPGEILAVVGSSGSGKSLLAHAILGILPSNATTSGELFFEGEALTQARIEELRGKRIALIPQSVNYLDPLLSVGHQIRHAFPSGPTEERNALALEIMARYGLAAEVFDYFPHQLSGGMARKVLLCTALAGDADLIIADEPTPGLDEASIAEVLKDFKHVTSQGKSILMITHDISAALNIADRVAIFYAGTTFEIADSKEFAGDGSGLRHPYTRALLRAMPSRDFELTSGSQPLPSELPSSCLYFERCPIRSEICAEERPSLRDMRGGKVRCFNAE